MPYDIARKFNPPMPVVQSYGLTKTTPFISQPIKRISALAIDPFSQKRADHPQRRTHLYSIAAVKYLHRYRKRAYGFRRDDPAEAGRACALHRRHGDNEETSRGRGTSTKGSNDSVIYGKIPMDGEGPKK